MSHQSLRASTKRLQTQVAGLEEMGATRRQALIDAHARAEELEAKLAAAATEHGAEREKMVGATSVQLSTHGSSSSPTPSSSPTNQAQEHKAALAAAVSDRDKAKAQAASLADQVTALGKQTAELSARVADAERDATAVREQVCAERQAGDNTIHVLYQPCALCKCR